MCSVSQADRGRLQNNKKRLRKSAFGGYMVIIYIYIYILHACILSSDVSSQLLSVTDVNLTIYSVLLIGVARIFERQLYYMYGE